MIFYVIFADEKLQKVRYLCNDKPEASDQPNFLQTCQTANYAGSFCTFVNSILGTDDIPFLEKVARAVAQYKLECDAIATAVGDGESRDLAIEDRTHPAVLAAIAQRPK